MKKRNLKYLAQCLMVCGNMIAFGMILNACDNNEEDGPYSDNDNPVAINSVHLEDVDYPDREISFARLGQLIRLDGSGFYGVKEVLINGENAYINPTLMTDNSLIISVPGEAPTSDAPDDVKNKIILNKKEYSYTYDFEIRAAAPSVTRISHTMPVSGDQITIYGKGLMGIHTVTFPGNITVNSGIVSDEEGEWCMVTVPANVSDNGGAILVLGDNGGAYTPANFNFKRGLLHDFDQVNNGSWSGGECSADLNALLPTTGNGPKSQGIYRSLNKDGITFNADAPKVAFYWANNGVWSNILTESVIPGNTPTADCGVQMDIFVEGAWNSGSIRIVVADGSGYDRYCMLYTPWEQLGKRIAWENPGCWFTITLPFSASLTASDFQDKTFLDVMNVVKAASYPQWGPMFDNIAINDVPAEPTQVKIYFDNLRVVPLTTPDYGEFGDE